MVIELRMRVDSFTNAIMPRKLRTLVRFCPSYSCDILPVKFNRINQPVGKAQLLWHYATRLGEVIF
jgi:hypothetical protein